MVIRSIVDRLARGMKTTCIGGYAVNKNGVGYPTENKRGIGYQIRHSSIVNESNGGVNRR